MRRFALLLAVVTLILFHILTLREPLDGALQGFLVGMTAGLVLGMTLDRLVLRPSVDLYLRHRHDAS